MPRKQRLLVYRLLMLYLSVMILLLLAVSAHSVHKVLAGILHLRNNRDIERNFTKEYPGKPNIHKYAEDLTLRLKRNTAQVNSINDTLPPALSTPLPALVLLVNQSGKVSVHKMDFSQQTEESPVKLQFDLITPLGQDTAGREFQNRWLNDPYLSVHFPEIKQLQVRRDTLTSGPVQITQYEAFGKE